MKEEDNELLYGEKEKKKRAKKEEKIKRKKIRTGGFVDEIYEDDLDEEAQEQEPTVRPTQNVQAATSEAHELLKKEIAAATADDSQELPDDYFDAPGNLTREFRFSKAILLKQNRRMRKKRLKSRNLRFQDAQQLNWQIKQRKAGDTPDIVRDSITKVTLFDYSDYLAGEMMMKKRITNNI